MAEYVQTQAASDVIDERRRQVEAKGWTVDHDDNHRRGELAEAAACYANYVSVRAWVIGTPVDDYVTRAAPAQWPWDDAYWKPSNPRRDLVKAAALILAEIERIDRVGAQGENNG